MIATNLSSSLGIVIPENSFDRSSFVGPSEEVKNGLLHILDFHFVVHKRATLCREKQDQSTSQTNDKDID